MRKAVYALNLLLFLCLLTVILSPCGRF